MLEVDMVRSALLATVRKICTVVFILMVLLTVANHTLHSNWKSSVPFFYQAVPYMASLVYSTSKVGYIHIVRKFIHHLDESNCFSNFFFPSPFKCTVFVTLSLKTLEQ